MIPSVIASEVCTSVEDFLKTTFRPSTHRSVPEPSERPCVQPWPSTWIEHPIKGRIKR